MSTPGASSLRILMLAPEPFFQPRGTPISVYFRNLSLTRQGHRVDLVTYPLGRDVELPGLTIRRLPNFLFLRSIKIGPSWPKVPMDAAMFARAAAALARRRYDAIFTHEEAGFLGAVLSRATGVPHIYDMHSSLPQQLDNYQFTRSRLLKAAFRRMERFILRNSGAVIAICPDLVETVRREGFGAKCVLIENVLDFPAPPATAEDVRAVRREIAPGGGKIVLYAGSFGPQQGIHLLVEAAARMREAAVVALVGGTPAEVEALSRTEAVRAAAGRLVLKERVAPADVGRYVAAADVLVSPRPAGTNTPLKIYSFLKSGKPLVATALKTHTQVLDESVAVLVEPTPEAMAAGLDFALSSVEARRRAANAQARARRDYTDEAYDRKIALCLEMARGGRAKAATEAP